jgi:hypothetical protein
MPCEGDFLKAALAGRCRRGSGGCSSLSRLIQVAFVAMTYGALFDHMPAGKAGGQTASLRSLAARNATFLLALILMAPAHN